jgi:CDP-glucose 4,6-dehydratase
MNKVQIAPRFWKGRNVFLTGHTGFKGGWMAIWLASMGAKITGYSLSPNTNPNLYEAAKIASLCERSLIGDIRDLNGLRKALVESAPDVVIHMAAQPLVRYSYDNPVETYATNVMGTVHLLESVRSCPSVRAVLIITTDKCYENKEWIWGYRENEPMGGYDPYSNSKGCAELVTASYRQSFFPEKEYPKHRVAIATARAGNVIGGGDWSEDRLIPDAIAAFQENRPLMVRNPSATRPWQHVLEPLSGYIALAQALFDRGSDFSSAWNFGPKDVDTRPVQDIIKLLISQWNGPATWMQDGVVQPHEAHFLKLDCSKAKQELNWSARWSLEMAISAIVEWQQAYSKGEDMLAMTRKQIDSYCAY